jgi:hypothetical protein
MRKPDPQTLPIPVQVTILAAVTGHPELIVGDSPMVDGTLAATLLANGQASTADLIGQ